MRTPLLLLLAACGQLPSSFDASAPDTFHPDSADASSPELGVATSARPASAPTVAPGRQTTAGTDLDGDGYPASTDCDDADDASYPGAPELDDLVDQDCDGWVDEDFVAEGDLVITEFNRQARFGGSVIDPNGSWIEVWNASDRTVDLSNWSLARGITTRLREVRIDPADNVTVAPGGFVVFCDTDNYQGSAGVPYPLTCDYVWGDESQASTYRGFYHDNTFELQRDSDRIALYVEGGRSTGRLVDQVTYYYDATNGYWPRVARYTTSLDPAYWDASTNDSVDYWCSTTESATGTTATNTDWQWYDTPDTDRDEHGSPGASNYNCPNDPDYDGDGYAGDDDCNDLDASVYPGAPETCDGVDEDCDGIVDDGTGSDLWYADSDGDGYGDLGEEITACAQPAGYVADATDCDDSTSAIRPGATETCDGIDQDCDGEIDDGVTTGDIVYYADGDNDGYGDAANTTTSCATPDGYTSDDTDCDDTNASVNPGAPEVDNQADDDCDDSVDEDFVQYGDLVFTEVQRSARFGGAAIVNDGSWLELYNASDRVVDLSNWTFSRGTGTGARAVRIDPAWGVSVAPGDYLTLCDTENYVGSAGVPYPLSCDYVWGDETQASTYRGTYHDNTLVIGRDSDTLAVYVDGTASTGRLVDSLSYYYDATNGYWPRVARYSMSLDPAYVDADLNDSVDVWCNTTQSSSGTTSTNTAWQWYDTSGTSLDEHGSPLAANYDCPVDPDLDGDGYGTGDCNDSDPAINPGATEVCDGVDNNCDGSIDESGSGTTYYLDSDGDGYGDASSTTSACTAPPGYVADATDCDDANGTTYPGAEEVCDDGINNDCDATTTCAWDGSHKVSDEYDFRAFGDEIDDANGSSISNSGDFNGDGYDDVYVGQSFYDASSVTNTGRGWVWYGPVDTTDTPSTSNLQIDGDTSRDSDYFGSSGRFVPDLNGDGFDELLVGAYAATSSNYGAAYLFDGGTSPSSVSSASADFTGTDANGYVGWSLAAGDSDGDLTTDIAVGAYGRSSSAGIVAGWDGLTVGGAETMTGTSTWYVTGASSGANLGYALAMNEDLDGDGADDLLMTAPATASTTTPGAAYLFYGVDAMSGALATSTADATFTGATNGDHFGKAAAFLGDTNDDGQVDFVITADRNDSGGTDAGAAYVWTSAPSGAVSASSASSVFEGEAAGDYFGRTAAGPGDVNDDGLAEVLIGATAWDLGAITSAGGAWLYFGPLPAGTTDASVYDARFTGSNYYDAVGYAVSGGGDVNADGFSDFMISATSWDAYGLRDAGAAWLYYGATD